MARGNGASSRRVSAPRGVVARPVQWAGLRDPSPTRVKEGCFPFGAVCSCSIPVITNPGQGVNNGCRKLGKAFRLVPVPSSRWSCNSPVGVEVVSHRVTCPLEGLPGSSGFIVARVGLDGCGLLAGMRGP